MGFMEKWKKFTDPVGTYQRQVAGTPQGGQFTEQYHVEVPLELTAFEVAQNDEGTWEEPAFPQTAAALIDFWMTVPVPDNVMDHMAVYQSRWHPGFRRHMARMEMIRVERRRLSYEEQAKLDAHPFQFPDGRVFNLKDGMKFYGVENNAALIPYQAYRRR